ncbi:MAG: alpha/beta fold hydrolase [Nitriliruptorales bacterium]
MFGEGPDLAVLLHGWPETGLAWREVAPLLAEAGWRVACPDLKGFGRTTSGDRSFTPRRLADEMSRLIRGLHVRKAAVVGHDWGGAVALATAFRHPGRVRGLVLSNSPYRNVDLRRAWHIPLLNLPVLPEAAAWLAPRVLVALAIRVAAEAGDAFPADVRAEYARGIKAGRWLGYCRTLPRRAASEWVRGRLRRALPVVSDPQPPHRLRVPASVVWGMRDPVLPPELGRRAADDLDASFVPIDGAGHFPHEEDPEAFARGVLDLIGPAAGEEELAGA